LIFGIFFPQKDLLSALFVGWNVLFTGLLVSFNNVFVLWKYWAFYITPSYHLANSWIWAGFYYESLDCDPRASPKVCPTIGELALNTFGYQAISSGSSILVLLGMTALFAVILAIYSTFKKPIISM